MVREAPAVVREAWRDHVHTWCLPAQESGLAQQVRTLRTQGLDFAQQHVTPLPQF
jgi:hypothetical protein